MIWEVREPWGTGADLSASKSPISSWTAGFTRSMVQVNSPILLQDVWELELDGFGGSDGLGANGNGSENGMEWLIERAVVLRKGSPQQCLRTVGLGYLLGQSPFRMVGS